MLEKNYLSVSSSNWSLKSTTVAEDFPFIILSGNNETFRKSHDWFFGNPHVTRSLNENGLLAFYRFN